MEIWKKTVEEPTTENKNSVVAGQQITVEQKKKKEAVAQSFGGF